MRVGYKCREIEFSVLEGVRASFEVGKKENRHLNITICSITKSLRHENGHQIRSIHDFDNDQISSFVLN